MGDAHDNASPEVDIPSAPPCGEGRTEAPPNHAPGDTRAKDSKGLEDRPGETAQESNHGTPRLAQNVKKRRQSPSESRRDMPPPTSASFAPLKVAPGKDKGYGEYLCEKKRKKRTGVRSREGPCHHSLAHVVNSVPTTVPEFCGTAAPCANPGYTSIPDHGKTYDFLEGNFDNQVAQLEERHYRFLEPPLG